MWRTQTQGGWGSKARGQNPGSFRDANFDDKFAGGMVVGANAAGVSGNSANFNTAGAIECFLPQGGTSGAFSENYTDPAGIPDTFGDCPLRESVQVNSSDTSAGVLAGQVVALTLNVAFDLPGSGGDSPIALADLIMVDTVCEGMTVQEVLDEANKVLAGSGSMTPSEINDCASKINENFVDGITEEGYLIAPTP
jgi:hypothetical protein